jgi:hypothetical protein
MNTGLGSTCFPGGITSSGIYNSPGTSRPSFLPINQAMDVDYPMPHVPPVNIAGGSVPVGLAPMPPHISSAIPSKFDSASTYGLMNPQQSKISNDTNANVRIKERVTSVSYDLETIGFIFFFVFIVCLLFILFNKISDLTNMLMMMNMHRVVPMYNLPPHQNV